LDILTYLADRPGEVITKQELMDHVWADLTVEEGSLRVHVAARRLATANLAIDTSLTSRDGATRSSARSSDLKMARTGGATAPISEEGSLRHP
jgi:hypothetical protein